MIAIRTATPDDAGLIFGFVRDLARHEDAEDKLVATEALLRRALEERGVEAAIAEQDGRAVGAALFFHKHSTWSGWNGLYLEDLYVAPEARGSGAGRALLAHVAAVGVARECTRVEWAVSDTNAAAAGFYRSLGAEPMPWRIYRVSGEALARLAGE
ncbi:GNAT family N-acetyltransferase [Sphingomonas sp. ACRSK]|uniref:GNAT family N-acetyltransferase n=1 Tax=Sphingomonas sp. ACRSK TaxID=2918213 RepID=UPI001EF6AE46|nr:GNAT family N-acetyltransferase [Sphingomonas sp. ACRSK]MCG7349682.1 GNAT family N-acetyltransferase [Sphingomonas sp. ACRSK]